jgi:site-specific recombinase XerD
VAGILTPGQHGDCPQFIPLLETVRIARRGKGRPRTRPGRAMADKAYSSVANGAYLRRRGIRAVIRSRRTRRRTAAPGDAPVAGRRSFTPRITRDPGMPLADVQWILGHAQLTTTQLYRILPPAR